MRWLKKLFTPRTFSSKDGESLTPYERLCLGAVEHPKCPDCGGKLLPGPRGVMSQNYLCDICNAEFNLSAWCKSLFAKNTGGRLMWAFCERISDRRKGDEVHATSA